MNDYQMGVIESRFADMIWENEPISTTELVKHCATLFEWKKSTTYTVLKRLCEKGIFANDRGTVTSKISKQDFYAHQSEKFIASAFNGSLPAFLAAFTTRNGLTPEDIVALRQMIEKYEEE